MVVKPFREYSCKAVVHSESRSTEFLGKAAHRCNHQMGVLDVPGFRRQQVGAFDHEHPVCAWARLRQCAEFRIQLITENPNRIKCHNTLQCFVGDTPLIVRGLRPLQSHHPGTRREKISRRLRRFQPQSQHPAPPDAASRRDRAYA